MDIPTGLLRDHPRMRALQEVRDREFDTLDLLKGLLVELEAAAYSVRSSLGHIDSVQLRKRVREAADDLDALISDTIAAEIVMIERDEEDAKAMLDPRKPASAQ